MEKKKIVSIIIEIIIIIIAVIMPFQLKQICYEHSIHQAEWSLGAWDAVYISAILYSIAIIILTIILLLLNIPKKSS